MASYTKTLIVISGPTGVGKTELCLSLATHLQCDIINCDSRQIFREIPIGTAAPTPEQQEKVRHHFVGTHSLTDYYSASMYESDALRVIEESSQPAMILTGGSMMYLDAVCKGIDKMPEIDESLRTSLKQRLTNEGLDALSEELHKLDPEYWNIVDRKNPRRILHALELCLQTGQTYTSLRVAAKCERPFRIVKIGLTRPREELYERINQRVLEMMDNGLENEARNVYPQRHLNALNTVGYKELFEYFDGNVNLQEAISNIQSDSREYMRKQLTWFKRDEDIHWFNISHTAIPAGKPIRQGRNRIMPRSYEKEGLAPSDIKEIIKYIDNCIDSNEK